MSAGVKGAAGALRGAGAAPLLAVHPSVPECQREQAKPTNTSLNKPTKSERILLIFLLNQTYF